MKEFIVRPEFNKMSTQEKYDYIVYYLKNVFPTKHCWKFLISYDSREDAEQELLLDLIENIDNYDPTKGTYDTYAYFRSRAIIKKMNIEYKKHSKNVSLEASNMSNLIYTRNNKNPNLNWKSMIERIPEKYHKIVEMRYKRNMSVKSIAKKLNLSKPRIYQILQNLSNYKKRFLNERYYLDNGMSKM